MRPEDRPKAIGLIVGVVVVFALVFMRVKAAFGGGDVPQPAQAVVAIGGNSSAAPAGTGQAPSSTEGGTPVATASGPTVVAGGPKKSDKIVIQPPKAPQTRNPFRQRQEKGQEQVVGSDPDFVDPKILVSKGPDPMRPLPGGTLPKISGSGTTPESISGLDVQKDVEAEMQLTGVIIGGRPVAVIRMGGKDFVVSAGDTFGKGFKLVSATQTQVIISQGTVKRTLKMDIPIG